MSDIARARLLMATASVLLEEAYDLMTREPPARKKAAPKRVRITEAIRKQVSTLVSEGKSNHEIANITGLHNAGHVSEIISGQR
jgi:hypothetical protein